MSKKILMVACDSLGIGGVQTVMLSIVRELHEDCEFHFVVFNLEDRENEEEFSKYGKIHPIPLHYGEPVWRSRLDYYIRTFYIYRNIKRIIRENGPFDIIHCHNYFEIGIELMAAKHCGVPCRIAHSHNNFPEIKGKHINKLYNGIYGWMIKHYATERIGCSRMACDYLYGVDGGGRVIKNAIDLTPFIHASRISPSNSWAFVHVGRLGEQKNQIFLVKVFEKVKENHSEATLTLVGGGNDGYQRLLEKEIESRKLTDSIKLLEPNTDIPAILSKNNLFLFPSVFEGLGIVVIEAQAVGMKCFASDQVPEEANLGLIEYLPIGDECISLWVNAIEKYVQENGVERTRVDLSKYDIRNVIKQYKEIYGI